jgi:hypothetical protein
VSVQVTTRYECDYCDRVEEVNGDDSVTSAAVWGLVLIRYQNGPNEVWSDLHIPQPFLCQDCIKAVTKAVKSCRQPKDDDYHHQVSGSPGTKGKTACGLGATDKGVRLSWVGHDPTCPTCLASYLKQFED